MLADHLPARKVPALLLLRTRPAVCVAHSRSARVCRFGAYLAVWCLPGDRLSKLVRRLLA